MLCKAKHRLWTYTGGAESYDFQHSEEARIVYSNGTSINNVAGADFDFDGRLDLLVSGTGNDDSPFLDIHFGDYVSFRTLRPPTVACTIHSGLPFSRVARKMELEPAHGEVLVLDANGDLLPDLFGTVASSNARGFWLNTPNGTFQVYAPPPRGRGSWAVLLTVTQPTSESSRWHCAITT